MSSRAKRARSQHPAHGVLWVVRYIVMGRGKRPGILIVVKASDKPFYERSRDFDATGLPVPADILVYTQEELAKLKGRFAQVLQEEMVWVAEEG